MRIGKVRGRGQRLLMCYTKIIVEVYSSVRCSQCVAEICQCSFLAVKASPPVSGSHTDTHLCLHSPPLARIQDLSLFREEI